MAFGAIGFAEYDRQADAYSFNFGPLIFAVLLIAGYVYWLVHLTRRFRLSELEIQRWQPLPMELLDSDAIMTAGDRAAKLFSRYAAWLGHSASTTAATSRSSG